jgi:hypothetical protein
MKRPIATAAGGSDWPPALRRLRRQLAGITAASTALLWLDNLSEHYRGGFQRKLMYVPIVVNPVVAAAGAVTTATAGERGRRVFEVLSAAQTVVAAVGFVEHQRGILKRPVPAPATSCSLPGTALRSPRPCSTSGSG